MCSRREDKGQVVQKKYARNMSGIFKTIIVDNSDKTVKIK